MRRLKGIAGATLLFGPNDAAPDLVTAMQFLADDLRAEGHRILGLKLGTRSLRIRTDEFDLALTHAEGPLPAESLTCVRRLSHDEPDTPDLVRARLLRKLREHHHAMGFIIRQRGALKADEQALHLELSRAGRRCLLPVFEAAPPCILIWQPGGLLFTPSEFLALEIEDLLVKPDQHMGVLYTVGPRRQAKRPESLVRPIRPSLETRAARAANQSAGHLFGTQSPRRPRVLPRLDNLDSNISAAFRTPMPAIPEPRAHRVERVVVAALWGVLLPQLVGGWLPL